ncbi:MAG: hypothetical protein A2Z14_06620 [Chloroflexi bacterium RBG_16_48_8]|nr:MAG: hypothetical protein A2Z14_06620 [Chloroflexi bacterium RBG_16_48_8]
MITCYNPGMISQIEGDEWKWTLISRLEIATKRFRIEVGDGDRTVPFVVLDRVQFELGTRKGEYSGIESEAVEDKDTGFGFLERTHSPCLYLSGDRMPPCLNQGHLRFLHGKSYGVER